MLGYRTGTPLVPHLGGTALAPCAALLVSAGPSEDQEVYTYSFQRGGRTQDTFLGLPLATRNVIQSVAGAPQSSELSRVERMTTPSQLEASEAWRKAGFLVRPFHGHDEEDAKRFHK